MKETVGFSRSRRSSSTPELGECAGEPFLSPGEEILMKIFISYRRKINQDKADRVYDELVKVYGRESVFKDVDSIQPGQDFRKVIQEKVRRCDVMLAVIGHNWASVEDDRGQKRLESPEDYVRIELETALKREIPIVPLLDGDARMPKKEELPETLGELVFR